MEGLGMRINTVLLAAQTLLCALLLWQLIETKREVRAVEAQLILIKVNLRGSRSPALNPERITMDDAIPGWSER
jgi:hypothetical protein